MCFAELSMPNDELSQVVVFERTAEDVALVTLNREEARNAVNEHVTQQLGEIVLRIEQDPTLLVAVLTGAGNRAFCAGADLKAISAGKLPELLTEEGGFADFVKRKRSKIWIAAVNGAAMAGGLEIMLACDFAIAADHATFALPEVKRGLIAAAGGLFRLPRAVSKGTAIRMIATGEPIDAVEACSRALVDQVVPRAELRATVLRIAGAIAANAPLAVLESVALARQSNERGEAELWEASLAAQERIVLTEDFIEGPMAFAQKRPPRWLGR
jgi:enoyl-CoA hydratase/carnithine racemase